MGSLSNLEMDAIYRNVDKLLKDGKFDGCGKILEKLDVKAICIDEMLSYLTSTLRRR
jgi:hypothetical protein